MSVTLLLFAGAREAAGTSRADADGGTVAEVLDWARTHFGTEFAAVVATSRVWVNGEPARPDDAVTSGDEVAVLPPVSGG